jgi:hypothetical protein
LNALASAVIGVPGKGECCGSKGACAPLDSANGSSLWLGRALQGEQRRMARRARCWRVRSTVTQEVKVIGVRKVNIHVALLKMTSDQLRFSGVNAFGS